MTAIRPKSMKFGILDDGSPEVKYGYQTLLAEPDIWKDQTWTGPVLSLLDVSKESFAERGGLSEVDSIESIAWKYGKDLSFTVRLILSSDALAKPGKADLACLIGDITQEDGAMPSNQTSYWSRQEAIALEKLIQTVGAAMMRDLAERSRYVQPSLLELPSQSEVAA